MAGDIVVIAGRKVVSLRGGVQAWIDEVMNSAITAKTPPEVAALSRYFGGSPRTGTAAARGVRRRGC